MREREQTQYKHAVAWLADEKLSKISLPDDLEREALRRQMLSQLQGIHRRAIDNQGGEEEIERQKERKKRQVASQ